MRSITVALVVLVITLLIGCSSQMQSSPPPTVTSIDSVVSGTVVDASGTPVRAATVRVQATTMATQTDAQGRFVLGGIKEGLPITISAWAEGYYCAKAEGVVPPADGAVLTLHPYQTGDNPAYEWVAPVGENSCYSCKASVTQVWLDNDAHARSATNPRFLTMYNGTDVDGNQSPLTRYGSSRDYGTFPLPPDPNQSGLIICGNRSFRNLRIHRWRRHLATNQPGAGFSHHDASGTLERWQRVVFRFRWRGCFPARNTTNGATVGKGSTVEHDPVNPSNGYQCKRRA